MLGACDGGAFLLLEVVASFESKERLESNWRTGKEIVQSIPSSS